MICYRDRTFCSSPHCKNECGVKLTDKIIKEANLWWKEFTNGRETENAPIATSYFCDENGKIKND